MDSSDSLVYFGAVQIFLRKNSKAVFLNSMQLENCVHVFFWPRRDISLMDRSSFEESFLLKYRSLMEYTASRLLIVKAR